MEREERAGEGPADKGLGEGRGEERRLSGIVSFENAARSYQGKLGFAVVDCGAFWRAKVETGFGREAELAIIGSHRQLGEGRGEDRCCDGYPGVLLDVENTVRSLQHQNMNSVHFEAF